MNKAQSILDRKNEILKNSIDVDFLKYKRSDIAFDYEKMMEETGYPIEEAIRIQRLMGVGSTPMFELKNINALIRRLSKPGKGARIFLKDEACNLSGSFKARRAAISVFHAKKLGYKGVIAATSGNYGAAVAAMCAKLNLKCIIVQECFDSYGVYQPEIIEKARAIEAYGAEVVQCSVGPELFVVFLDYLDQTGYFNASLYSPYGIAGLETLGMECVEDIRRLSGKDPSAIIVTHAGGGNLTATARGAQKAGSKCEIIAASVDLHGLHMASDRDFNRKSFTTGHTGFGFPFAIYPDRSDVTYSAARALRYMDSYYTVKQGEVFYITEALAKLEGLERGPAGNTSLAVAFSLAQQRDEDDILVVQETEYTSAGKHYNAQLSFAKNNGIEILTGDPKFEVAGTNIILPAHPKDITAKKVDLDLLRISYIRQQLKLHPDHMFSDDDLLFLAKECKVNTDWILSTIKQLKGE
ncbi:MAG: PLP-dependent lyase/thiolase [Firmicutes bacterium HGW-Firmicutes-19]|jgi:2-amino-4-ketopentanoate thiolase beta subunit|nr:MAG: PLP-dependent lyase/thiolase [Firmicutes bacterium HGW-Firmicutes-19]